MRACCMLCSAIVPEPTAAFWRNLVLHARGCTGVGAGPMGLQERILANLGSLMRKLTVTQGASGGTCLSAPPSSHNTSLYS